MPNAEVRHLPVVRTHDGPDMVGYSTSRKENPISAWVEQAADDDAPLSLDLDNVDQIEIYVLGAGNIHAPRIYQIKHAEDAVERLEEE